MDTKTFACKFGDSLVAYLYDEMPVADRGVFEEHLVGCEACTDEFAALSVARFEVFDWKREEFDSLPTPEIVVPYPVAQAGWLDGVRAALSWATVIPAMAAVLVVLGVGYVLWSNSGVKQAPEVAANVAVTSPAAPVEVKKVEAPVVAAVETPSSVSSDPKVEPRRVVSRREIAAARTSRMLVPPVKETPVKAAPDQMNDTVAAVRQTVKPAPRLTAYSEDDDNSLRLSDLFDETGPPEE